MKKVLVIAIALTFALSVTALAGNGHNPIIKIGMHTKAHPTSCTKGYPVFTSCSNIITTTALCEFDVMPVFFDLVEVTVTEFGLTWPAEWGTMSWVRCKGTIAVGGILNPGEGTAISFQTCQYSWSIAPGYGWLIATGPGTVTPIPYFATGDYGVVDCQPSPGPYYDYPVCIFSAGACGLTGDDPCFPTAVEPSTWGSIKSMFE
jgi:hypothetical protein